jgi:acetyl esterase
VRVPLFPEAAFPGDMLSGSENRSGLYLQTYGIYGMVRNYIKNTDDGRDPLHHPDERAVACGPAARDPGHQWL